MKDKMSQSINHKPVIIADKNIPFLRRRLESVAEIDYLSQEEITPEKIKDADCLIIRTRTICDASLLESSNVRAIVTATIGTDHIDMDYCKKKGIAVFNAPGCNAPGVAQYVWSALLRLDFDTSKQKIGIVGCGNVGTIVAQWGLLIGCEVLVSDPPKSKEDPSGKWLPENGKGSIRMASLKEILRECDAVTLHTPLTRTGENPTFHLIGAEELALMKNGAILVNAARGEVVDNVALENELKRNRIKAVIDTWEDEPELNRSLLDKVTIATPHIAGYSRQGKERATRMSIENLEKVFGITGDTSGLEGKYILPAGIDENLIINSYDPFKDSDNLKNNPSDFEKLRHEYDFRDEVTDNQEMKEKR